MELGFRDPQLHTTVLPHLINLPTLRTFLAPLWTGMQHSLTVRASLNGIALDHQLVATESGFYLQVIWEGSPYRRLSIWPGCTGTRRFSRVATSTIGELRCTYLEAIGLSSAGRSLSLGPIARVTWKVLSAEGFQDNFWIGQVHLSYYLTEPVADPGWSIRWVIP